MVRTGWCGFPVSIVTNQSEGDLKANDLRTTL